MNKHEFHAGDDFILGTVYMVCQRQRGYGIDFAQVHIMRAESPGTNHLATSWLESRTMHDGTQTSPDMWVDPMTGGYLEPTVEL